MFMILIHCLIKFLTQKHQGKKQITRFHSEMYQIEGSRTRCDYYVKHVICTQTVIL